MTTMTNRDLSTPSRLEALRQARDGLVEYEAGSATYWVEGVAARGWKFRTLSDLVRHRWVQRPAGSARGPVRITEQGRAVLEASSPTTGS